MHLSSLRSSDRALCWQEIQSGFILSLFLKRAITGSQYNVVTPQVPRQLITCW